MSTRNAPTPPSPPTEHALREAALRHLSRYAATEARLLSVLHRRIDRWLRAAKTANPDDDAPPQQAAAARAAAQRVVASLATQGAVNNAAYAETRARTLRRSGRSAAAIATHLATKGIPLPQARAVAAQTPTTELAAALMLAKKRRLGPFATTKPTDPAARCRTLAAFARAGFTHATATVALSTPLEAAEAMILSLRHSA